MGALAGYAAIAADRLGPLLGGLGAASALVLALALVARLAVLVPWALALLGCEYAAFLYLGGGGRALPPCAAGFVLVAELAYWALEPVSTREEGAGLASRAATVALTAVGAGGLGALLTSVSNEDLSGGLGIEAAGIAAAVAALGVVVWLARGLSR